MDGKKITLLVIDDNSDDRELYKQLLSRNERIGTILEADNVQQGLLLYQEHHIDCALVDYRLPGKNGIDFIETVNNLPHPFVPIIILTGHGNEKVAVDAMKAGATDYLTKDELAEQLLNKTIEHVLEKSKLIAALNEKTRALETMATTDSLTGLLNRRAFQKEVKKRLSEAKRHHRTLAVLFIDLDNFKSVNDVHSHKVGDRLLCLASTRLKRCLRDEDIACRFGGDEFVVLATGIQRESDAPDIAKKIINTLSKPYKIEGNTLHITACIGVAYSDANKSIENLIQESDLALYQAKHKEKKGMLEVSQQPIRWPALRASKCLNKTK